MGNGNNENIESSLEELKKFLTKENTRKVEIGLTSKDDAIKFNLSVDKSKLDVQTKEMVSAFIGAVL